jgi:general secretion pathway protein J
LIEVMVVLVIMSIMALLSWQGIQTMLKTREQSLGLVSGVDSIQTALSQWRVDLDNTLSSPPSATVPSLDWDARVLRMVRRSSAPLLNPNLNSGSLGFGGDTPMTQEASATPALWVVAWSARNLSASELGALPPKEQRAGLYWLRWQSPPLNSQAELNAYWQLASQWGQNPSAETRVYETVLFEIQNWQLYFYRNNAWTNALSSAGENASTLNPPPIALSGSGSKSGAPQTSNGSSSDTGANITNTPQNANNSGRTNNTGVVFPDGVRLKLYVASDKVLGSGAQSNLSGNSGNSGNAQNDPALTLDWVRLNFTAARLP